MKNICTFIGHSIITIIPTLIHELTTQIEKAINQGITTFYCGGYGDFDILCAKTVKELKVKYPHIKSYLITPYITENYLKKINFYLEEKLYDGTIYPELENVPLKFAICRRNEYMVDNAEIILVYVTATFGGAYKTLNYAKRKKKNIIYISNLYD